MFELLSSRLVWAFCSGLLISCAIEMLLKPRPHLRRPIRCWLLHVGTWTLAFAALYLITRRPTFSTVSVLTLWLVIVQVSNSKYRTLREPFVCADFEYFNDALFYPRLYLPFFGIGKAAWMTVAFLAFVGTGLHFEATGANALMESGALALVGVMLTRLGSIKPLHPTFDAVHDLTRWGMTAALWAYFRAARKPVDIAALPSAFTNPSGAAMPTETLPDMVSVQSESFFDPRRLWPGVRQEVLINYDKLREEAAAHGRLQVAAWGANTVRTEFTFLTGLQGKNLGIHRFNPYRRLAQRHRIPSIASYLKSQGYRTVCIHPYVATFYGRHRVLPALGFDEFIDIRSFNDTQKAGPFIGDRAVADKVTELLQEKDRKRPLFIHVVTMENHGPLHLEQFSEAELPTWFNRPLPDALHDLAPYVRHLCNADHMLKQLRETLLSLPRPAALCFYGDHVPILPDVYQSLGTPDGDTDYLIWTNETLGTSSTGPLAVEDLANAFIHYAYQTKREVA